MTKDTDNKSVIAGGQVLGRFSITDEAKSGLLREKVSIFALLFCLVLIASQASLIFFNFSNLPPAVPLFYSKPWGESMLASPANLWLLPSIALLFIVVNFVLAVIVHKLEQFISKVLVLASALVAFISFYAVLKVITLLI